MAVARHCLLVFPTPNANPGFDEFDFKVGGLLLFLNTFGTEILAALALPLAAAAAAPGGSRDFRCDPPSRLGGPSTGTAMSSPTPVRGQEEYRHPPVRTSSPPPWNAAAAGGGVLSAMERLSALTLLLSSFRTFLSAANVSVQRGHLMLWAVFAPKFVFDATMQAVCGAAAVLAWAVVLVAHRAYCFPAGRRRWWWWCPGAFSSSSSAAAAAANYRGRRGSLSGRKKAR